MNTQGIGFSTGRGGQDKVSEMAFEARRKMACWFKIINSLSKFDTVPPICVRKKSARIGQT